MLKVFIDLTAGKIVSLCKGRRYSSFVEAARARGSGVVEKCDKCLGWHVAEGKKLDRREIGGSEK